MEVKKIYELITTNEICELYKVTPMTVYNWRQEGLPFEKIGHRVRFDPLVVEKWLMDKKK